MKRIGICTLYHKNRNYGACLQAYALQHVLEQLGAKVQIVSYSNCTRFRSFLSELRHKLRKKSSVSKSIITRNTAIDAFRNEIPHSKCYYPNTISSANQQYDCFITGSDQVWNPDWINPYLSLQFADKDKITAAYAASTGKISLNEAQQEKLSSAIARTRHISIREKESIPALQRLTKKKIDYVLDPTLLLTKTQWDELCSKRVVDGKYLFCYFLCGNEQMRNTANEFAKCRNLKIVTMPHLSGEYRQVDDGFGNIQLYDVSPKEFLSLIKYAAFVLTDSFHAAVFAHIYERKFAVTGNRESEMGCRMQSLTGLFGTEKHYLPGYETISLDVLCDLMDQPMILNYEKYQEMRQYSFDFLKKVLNDAQ